MSDSTVRFGLLVSMFQAMLRDRSAAKKRKRFRTFLDRAYTGQDYFGAVRLLLPSLDRERGSYGLKESTLATCLVDALGIARDSEDALRLVNWRKGGARTGANAGNFSLVAAEVLQRRQGIASGGLTIKELNDALDQLASKENRGEKTDVLAGLIKKTNAVEMKRILMIILKDLKLGISEKSIFHEFHPDAEDLFNVTCDLKLVCEKLKDRSQRHKRQDIEVGKAVRPQLAMRVSDATAAWKKLHGKNVVVECKFDGDRIQLHKNGAEIHYFSRNFLDHSEYVHGMSNIVLQNIKVDRCILDGEMLVWDTSTNRFAEFGSNQEIAKAAREGLESDRQLCYVAFDILYFGDTSVIHQSLTERHELLRKVVKPLKGRLEILIPNGSLNDHHFPGEPCWSIVAYSVEDVERFFKATIDNRDEGIVLKDLGSKWEPGDRSGKWMKLKPDYIHASADLDVLIIGGYFGSGRHGGEVAQFLVGLAERSDLSSYPMRFISFCRVGTGLSDEDLHALITKLKPYFRKNEYPKRAPRCYEVTNNSKERPDVWIDTPDKSVILSITSDIRTIKSEVFAAPYSLRFPRIQRVRYDKPWHECLDVQSFIDLVHSSNGNTQRGTDHGALGNQNMKQIKRTKKEDKKNISIVPTHLIQTDVSGVKEETLLFANMMFYFINVPPSYSVDHFHKMVTENGGTFSMNLNGSVTHCISAEQKGIKYQAAMRHGDIIHISWILDSCAQKQLVHLQPKYFLFLADSSKIKFEEEIDKFSDYYYWDLDITDMKQIFSNMDGSEVPNNIEFYKKKYYPLESLCLFQDCRIYFYEMSIMNKDLKITSDLALKRMRLEITMRAGEICDNLALATHLVAYTMLGSHNFDEIYKSLPSAQKRRLHDKRLHVVMHQWLDDSVKNGKKLLEDAYNLKPDTLEELKIEESKEDHKVPDIVSKIESQKVLGALDTGEKRKRGRPPHTNIKRGGAAPVPYRKTRARIGNRPAKINSDDLEHSDSMGEDDGKAAYEPKENDDDDTEQYENIKDQGKEESSSEQDVKDQGVLGALYTVEKRKRGRPPRTDIKRRRAPVPYQRTRARTGKCTIQINLDELEHSDSMGEDDGKTAHELKEEIGDDTEQCDNTKDQWKKESTNEQDVKDQESTDDALFAKSFTKEETPEKDILCQGCEIVPVMETQQGAGKELEQTIDPLQAMLLDMIPTLSQKREGVGSSSFAVGQKREGDGTSLAGEGEKGEKPLQDTDVNPAKKKVSYKDLADQLLKDW
ncbi:DNA ligase 4 [Iris pallida]|uniref:DNA ligase n=1 Tax=Iris pallida TaxID=29817 RepID=A0AAX6I1K2_IRIPA|nr:DNA ligase 4 [Iris pallida]